MNSGGRATSRWLLLLSVMAGLVGMHHVLLAHELATSAGATPMAVSAGPSPDPQTVAMTQLAPTAAVVLVPALAAPAVFGAPPDPTLVGADPGMAMSMLMHPCLAVLALLLVLALVAALVRILRRREHHGPAYRRGVVAWPRPPPRTAIRLSLLCVLRN